MGNSEKKETSSRKGSQAMENSLLRRILTNLFSTSASSAPSLLLPRVLNVIEYVSRLMLVCSFTIGSFSLFSYPSNKIEI